MKTVILCGGKGTRLKEETEWKPKPMVEVGGMPILWHIMKIYAAYGHNEFILPLGYKGHMIKQYFLDRKIKLNNFTFNTQKNELKFHSNENENFQITFVETGLETGTAERVLKILDFIPEENFMVTYGDGVANIDINKLIDFHKNQNSLLTITGTKILCKFGILKMEETTNLVSSFHQKPFLDGYINGGFMVMKKSIASYLKKDGGYIEDSFPELVDSKRVSIYHHDGFWTCVDTYRELEELNRLWDNNERFWAVWEKDITIGKTESHPSHFTTLN